MHEMLAPESTSHTPPPTRSPTLPRFTADYAFLAAPSERPGKCRHMQDAGFEISSVSYWISFLGFKAGTAAWFTPTWNPPWKVTHPGNGEPVTSRPLVTALESSNSRHLVRAWDSLANGKPSSARWRVGTNRGLLILHPRQPIR